MKVNCPLFLLLLVVSSVLCTTCQDTSDPGANLDYAAKAKEIAADMYTPQNDLQVLNFSDHFETILAILGIPVVDDETQDLSNTALAMTKDCVEDITGGMLTELMQYDSDDKDNSSLQIAKPKMYYPLGDIPGFLSSAGFAIEREEGYGDLTADDLTDVMDYYIALYENNETIEREQFAGYLIGAIAHKNPDVGTYVDLDSLDRLQLFLFILDALTLPENSPYAVSGAAMRAAHPQVAAGLSMGSTSYWGLGAKQANVRPQNTKNTVRDLVGEYVKTYAYYFDISGPREIYCDTWEYTAFASRICTATETPHSSSPLAPLDCSGVPKPVKGITVQFDVRLQEHVCLGCLVPEQTSEDGWIDAEVVCSKPNCDIKSFTPGTKKVNGSVAATFRGTDTGLTPPYTIFPARAVLKVSERVGGQFECHED